MGLPHTLILLALCAGTVVAQSEQDIRHTVQRALPLIGQSTAKFVENRACVSCHHNLLSIPTFHLAIDRGFAISKPVVDAVEEKTFKGLLGPQAFDDAVQANAFADPTPNQSYLLIALHEAGVDAGLTAAVHATRIARWQRGDHWVTSDFRPPHSSSVFTATATAIRAVRWYMPEELRVERDATIARARKWLATERPLSTEDAAFRLMGLAWAEASATEISAAGADLLAMQKSNGGWAQTAEYSSDAYSTGEALYALREAGMAASEPAWRKGAKFLISTQAADGSWRTRTRMISPASVSPKYFTTGFPYQKDEYLSYAGSCWAVMGLLAATPSKGVGGSAVLEQDVAPKWARTALFGTVQELRALLDGGLDPNSETPGGSTLLMMAATDADKVQLLLSKGARVNAKSKSGTDALTVAASYRGTAKSVESLLNSGAEAQAAKGVRVRQSALLFAARNGDVEIARLLLAHGADPSATAGGNAPLAETITFSSPEVAKLLIKAGADAKLTESSGVNLLHWATIANRPELIPILAKAGVPLNAEDDNGYTPLMYAATIDFGDTEVLKALLAAGADKRVRNYENRTPLGQAQHFKHARLAAELR